MFYLRPLFFLSICLTLCTSGFAQPTSKPYLEQTKSITPEYIKALAPAIGKVRIKERLNNHWSIGSGTYVGDIGSNYFFLTCNHVIRGCKKDSAEVWFPYSQQSIRARVINTDFINDLSLLLLEYKPLVKPILVSKRDRKLQTGQYVYTFGITGSRGEGITIRPGRVTSSDLKDIEIWNPGQVSHPGDSGGPLVDTYGELIGVLNKSTWGNNPYLGNSYASNTSAVLRIFKYDYVKPNWPAKPPYT